MDNQIIAQSIGFVALVFSVLLFQKNNRSTMLKLMMTASLLYTVHFYLLGALTGALLNSLTAARSYVYFNKNDKKWASYWLWPLFFAAICIAICIFTWAGYYSILPVVAVTMQTFIFWSNNTKLIRYFSLIVPPFWFTYNIIVGSIPGAIIETLIFCSVCLAIYRFDIKTPK